jgi:hypothetical protein
MDDLEDFRNKVKTLGLFETISLKSRHPHEHYIRVPGGLVRTVNHSGFNDGWMETFIPVKNRFFVPKQETPKPNTKTRSIVVCTTCGEILDKKHICRKVAYCPVCSAVIRLDVDEFGLEVKDD